MIKPNMATMLGFLATDAGIARDLLDPLVGKRRMLPSTALRSMGIPRPTIPS